MSGNSIKGLLLVADGMGDRPCKELNGKTPLAAANRSNLDKMAEEADTGLMDVIAPGIRCGSDTGHLSLLGYDARAVYTGRGPFEALGIGMEVSGGDIAFRCNFSTVNDDWVITDRRAGRINSGTSELAEMVNGVEIDGIICYFKESIEHRGALLLRGPGLSPHVTDTDPHDVGAKVWSAKAADGSKEAEKTAKVVNEFVKMSYEKLNNHPVNVQRRNENLPPANIILPRGAGEAPKLKNFNELHNVKAACVVETALVRGIARFVGITPFDAPGGTGTVNTDMISMADTVIKAFDDHNFVLCNVKAPDLAGHDNLPVLKKEIIERFDAMVGYLAEKLAGQAVIAVTADHSTPCEIGDHSGDPVPLMIWGPGVRGDKVEKFKEKKVYKGALNRIRGIDLINILTQLMGVQEKFGA